MAIDPRENQIDYVEFPASPGESFAIVKRFYKDAFGWKYQDWGDEYSDTKDSGITTGLALPRHIGRRSRSWFCIPLISKVRERR